MTSSGVPATKSREVTRLQSLLRWMALQDFSEMAAGDPSLLRQVELIVVDGHRRLYVAKAKPWSEPIAYRWLRYEDPQPLARLADGLRRLLRQRVNVDADAVDKACAEARRRGFSY
jgi:hypothetical protein